MYSSVTSYHNSLSFISVPKAIAFDVSLDGQNTQLLLTRKPPQRLQVLVNVSFSVCLFL